MLLEGAANTIDTVGKRFGPVGFKTGLPVLGKGAMYQGKKVVHAAAKKISDVGKAAGKTFGYLLGKRFPGFRSLRICADLQDFCRSLQICADSKKLTFSETIKTPKIVKHFSVAICTDLY